MGIEFDPEWEYYTPDEEIQDVMYRFKITSILELLHPGGEEGEINLGMRFGRGDPDRYVKLTLAPARGVERYKTIPNPWRQCSVCKEWFEGNRTSTKYCSNKCAPHPGRPRELEQRDCQQCSKSFRPITESQILCSKTCVSKRPKTNRKANQLIDGKKAIDVYTERYLKGDKLSDIAKDLGMATKSLQRWREMLGLPARPMGNHSRN